MSTNNLLGNRLRVERHRASLSQKALAELVGTDQTIISRIERGSSQSTPEMLKNIARQLGVTLSHLLGEDTEDGRYDDSHPARKILTNYNSPHGLRDLASDGKLVEALRILPHEWETLLTVALSQNVTKDGYVQLLICIRAITSGTASRS